MPELLHYVGFVLLGGLFGYGIRGWKTSSPRRQYPEQSRRADEGSVLPPPRVRTIETEFDGHVIRTTLK